MTNLTAITIGDINGIGIEILIKLCKKNKIKKIIFFIIINFLKIFLKKRKINLKINILDEKTKNLNYKNGYLNIFSYKAKIMKKIPITHLNMLIIFVIKIFVLV